VRDRPVKRMERKHDNGPEEAAETVRKRILTVLEEGEWSGRDISGLAGIPEKEVYGHLEHIRTSLHRDRKGKLFRVRPAECMHCGFLFEKRERLTKPGKCPVCRKGPVQGPLFSIRMR